MCLHNQARNLLVRITLLILIGGAIIAANSLTVDAKEKTNKHAMKEMIKGAKTPTDHQVIADYYKAEAAKARAKADKHDQMAASYAVWNRQAGEGWRKFHYPPGTVEHCEKLVEEYTAKADKLTALAKEHEAVAERSK
jgi:hypothetical protein